MLSTNYVSKSFQDRIEISLANISRSKDDKFSITGIGYIPATFKCELCGHNPCLYVFYVKNLETNVTIKTGSECIAHFRGECNIDIAVGLRKRIKSVTRKMRRYMKKSLDGDDYKEMAKEAKREMTLKLFMKHQAMEALRGDSKKKTLLSKEDVLAILRTE